MLLLRVLRAQQGQILLVVLYRARHSPQPVSIFNSLYCATESELLSPSYL